jgi:hypothetical protein
VILEVHHIGNYDEFSLSTVVFCYNKDEGCEEAVVEQIAAKHRKTSDDQQTDEEDATEHELVTIQDDRKFIAGLRLHFMQEGNEGFPATALETCFEFV